MRTLRESSPVGRVVTLGVLACCVALAVAASAWARLLDDDGAGGATAEVALCGTDEFDGATLDDARWDVLRPDATGPTVGGGKLNLPLGTGDLIAGSADAQNLVLQDAPTGGWTATTELNVQSIDANGEQAGLALWRSEGNLNNTFAKVTFIQNNAGVRGFEAIYTDRSTLAIPIPDSVTGPVAVQPNADVSMRLRSDGSRVVAEYSLDDGATWTKIGQTATLPGPVRVGVFGVRGGGNGGVVPYERYELAAGRTPRSRPTTRPAWRRTQRSSPERSASRARRSPGTSATGRPRAAARPRRTPTTSRARTAWS